MPRPLLSRFVSRRRRLLVSVALLLALLPRAWIPVGYMPVAGQPFALQMCASGFPAALLALAQKPRAPHVDHRAHAGHHMEHSGHEAHAGGAPAGYDAGAHTGHEATGNEHCVFAALAASGLLAPPLQVVGSDAAALRLPVTTAPARAGVQRHLQPQARGPPSYS